MHIREMKGGVCWAGSWSGWLWCFEYLKWFGMMLFRFELGSFCTLILFVCSASNEMMIKEIQHFDQATMNAWAVDGHGQIHFGILSIVRARFGWCRRLSATVYTDTTLTLAHNRRNVRCTHFDARRIRYSHWYIVDWQHSPHRSCTYEKRCVP